MSARPIGKAMVAFNLVNIPVGLYSTADNTQKVSFNWINPSTGARVRQRFWDPKEERIVEREELVKGYEFSKDQYVLFNPDELKVLEAQATNRIEIQEFIPFEQVERIYLSKAYYLGPEKGGEPAYHLLAAALRETGRAAVGRYAARGKEYLVLVRPIENGLIMEQLYYTHELRSITEVPVGEGKVKGEELAMAVQLVSHATSDEFRPDKYDDDVTKRVLALIEKKIEGEEITAAPEVEPEGKIIDLMEALKASLAASAESADPQGERKPAKPATSKKKAAGGKSGGKRAAK